jgi:3-dehydroquinate synthetase
MQAMEQDKKKVGGKLKFFLPVSIGEALVSDNVNIQSVEQVLKEL